MNFDLCILMNCSYIIPGDTLFGEYLLRLAGLKHLGDKGQSSLIKAMSTNMVS